MANKDNIARLTKYQMRVLYYKCKEGATHEEIAAILGRDVNTVQYHMTRIYTVLEIKRDGTSREEMESELKREICPIIRGMFNSYDDVKIWAPLIRDRLQEEDADGDTDETDPEEAQPPYIPPPSVRAILGNPENGPTPPAILEPPPPGRRRRNWWLILGLIISGSLIVTFLSVVFLKNYSSISATLAEPTNTPMQLMPTAAAPPQAPAADVPANTPVSSPVSTFIIQVTTDSKDGMVLVHIPAGDFEMGSSRDEDPQALDEESPQHIVTLDDYWIDKTEVTNAQYAMCVADSGACTKPANNFSSTRGSYYDDSQYADYPVIFVSWSQASAYCMWAGRRLPTEAEWEKAARGPDGFIYPWGNTFDGTFANYCDSNCDRPWKDNRFSDGFFDTSPVEAYIGGGSMYGVLGMAGNVYEWVADWFAPYGQDPQKNPTGPDSGLEKTIRGGSWGDDPAHIRSSMRSRIKGDNWLDFIGFRCAR